MGQLTGKVAIITGAGQGVGRGIAAAMFCGNDPMPIETTSEEYLRSAVQTNIFGLLYFMQACFPYLKKGRGRVINFATGAGIEGWSYLFSYAATKEAIRGMTRVAAREWGSHGITVNVIAPMANSPSMQTAAASCWCDAST